MSWAVAAWTDMDEKGQKPSLWPQSKVKTSASTRVQPELYILDMNIYRDTVVWDSGPLRINQPRICMRSGGVSVAVAGARGPVPTNFFGTSRAFHSRRLVKKASSSDKFPWQHIKDPEYAKDFFEDSSLPRCLPRSFSTRKLSRGFVVWCSGRKLSTDAT